MVDLSRKNWRARQASWASWALLVCLVAGVGCGEMDDTTEAPLETQQQALEVNRAAAELESSKPLPDGTGEEYETKSNWNFHGQSTPDGMAINVGWSAHPGDRYDLCWKKASDSGTVCSNNKAEIIAGGTGYYSGTQYGGFQTECGGVEYKIRVKRNAFSYRTINVTTNACEPANACPFGGWYDGANCQIGQAPSGTSAFIYNGAYYYSYANGSTKCPLPGSHDDGANCFVQWIPSGVSPFIYLNHWYYTAYP